MTINGVNPNFVTRGVGSLQEPQSIGNQGIEGFKKIFEQALEQSNVLRQESDQITNDILMGKSDNLHAMMIAGEKADVALQLTMQIRNKILDAYNEIMRMQI